MVSLLCDWWELNLDDAQRAALMDISDGRITDGRIADAFAEELLHASPLVVLHAEPSVDSSTGVGWALDPEVAAFVAERARERHAAQASL